MLIINGRHMPDPLLALDNPEIKHFGPEPDRDLFVRPDSPPYRSIGRFGGAEHLEEFVIATGHGFTVDHSRGDTVDGKYQELMERLGKS